MASAAAATKATVKPTVTRKARKPAQKEKQKPIAFVNWRIADEKNETLLRSTRGFSLFDNDYLTIEDKALIELAQNNGGEAIINAELRIIIAKEKPDHIDTSKIKLVSSK